MLAEWSAKVFTIFLPLHCNKSRIGYNYGVRNIASNEFGFSWRCSLVRGSWQPLMNLDAYELTAIQLSSLITSHCNAVAIQNRLPEQVWVLLNLNWTRSHLSFISDCSMGQTQWNKSGTASFKSLIALLHFDLNSRNDTRWIQDGPNKQINYMRVCISRIFHYNCTKSDSFFNFQDMICIHEHVQQPLSN